MKRAFFITTIVILLPIMASSQLKKQSNPIDIRSGILQADNGKILGIIDPSKIQMSHSYSLSYQSMGDMSLGRSLYLNTLSYKLSDPLSMKVQWGIQNFPYNSLGNNHPAFQNGFVFSGMELKYKPSDKFMLKFQYSALPQNGYYYSPYNRYSPYDRFRSSNMFWDDDEE